MSDGRAYLLRVWQLAEELAVRAGTPLHAFLLLHHVLTRPPPALRSAGMTIPTTTATAAAAAAAAVNAAPLHLPSLDAEWKCEELATRVRAAEYLLYPDAASRAAQRDVSSPTGAAAAVLTGASLPTPHALSRVAALESLELAEQVLAPVFAASSSSLSSSSLSSSPSYTGEPDSAGRTGASRDAAFCALGTGASSSYDAVLSEVSQTSANANLPSGSAPSPRGTSSYGNDAAQAGHRGAEVRVASMYFLSESTVTALAWPLTSFTLTWPCATTAPHGTDSSISGNQTAAAQTASLPALRFKAANQTIMIAVALVVRAHVLQAVVCHRRVQYRRALQCLAEARRWVQRQFADAAQSRSLRLLRADLQERWSGAAAAGVASAPSPPRIDDDLASRLPHFDRVMRRLMQLEQRACEAMISVEECKVHFAILHACGSLPPPPLPLVVPPHEAAREEGAAAGTQPSVHAPDLRLHYKRYQESVQQLHQASSVYMRVLEWIEEEEKEEGDAGTDSEGGRSGAAHQESERRVRVKTERSGDTKEDEKNASMPRAVLSKVHMRLVQTQLSSFCLCALHKHSVPSPSVEAPLDVHGVKREGLPNPVSHSHFSTSSGLEDSTNSAFIVNYDTRLAAEVLGWYHCISFFYVLYQHTANSTTPASNREKHGGAVGDRRGAANDEGAETAFFARYAGVPTGTTAATRTQHQTLSSSSPSASPLVVDSPLSSSPVSRDPVQRALAHFRIFAYFFGSFPTVLDSERRDSSSGGSDSTPRWRARGAAGSWSSSSATARTHESELLLCLAELALADNYPFALRLCNEAKEGVRVSPATEDEKEAPTGNAATSLSMKREAAADNDEDEACGGQQQLCPSVVARKRGRATCIAPPPSWHWVLPGVRATLQLYLALTTVLMQAAATLQTTSTPPPSPRLAAAAAATPRAGHSVHAAASAAASHASTPPVPILQSGLQRAEQALARLLFALDREMLQLTGNVWTLSTAPPHPSAVAATRHTAAIAPAPLLSVDFLQSSPPAQLRWLVQLKAAALLTMGRHHLTQLSVVRAVHYLREAQQFTRVFHRQTKLSPLPEMHVLLATVATCMSLRRLPDLPPPQQQQQQQQRSRGLKRRRETDGRQYDAAALDERDVNNNNSSSFVDDGDASDGDGGSSVGDDAGCRSLPRTDAASAQATALYHFAQGWHAVDAASSRTPPPLSGSGVVGAWPPLRTQFATSVEGSGPLSVASFAITPAEEATIAQDVGLPYLHLLAAERAACTSLHTPPSFVLLLYLLKAWAVYQLVAAAEELTWQTDADAAEREQRTGDMQQQPKSPYQHQQQQQNNASVVSPLSPASAPLPTASYATTTLNSTVEDQQRRVARLDSVTSTPTNTPQLRSRHATVPAEMQRIQLDQPPLTSTVMAPGQLGDRPAGEEKKAEGGGQPRSDLPSGRDMANRSGDAREGGSGDAPSTQTTAPPPPPSASALTLALNASHKTAATTYPRLSSPPVMPLPPSVGPPPFVSLPPSQQPSRQQHRLPVQRARVTTVPQTVRHRAGDILQRMMAVLRHHYDAYTLYTTSRSPPASTTTTTTAAAAAPTTAWTPHNVTLFRLLRGAVLLTEDRDEPAAARELKETTHYAKQRLGVLHPYVADGLALLTSAYTSLDLDTVSPSASALNSHSSNNNNSRGGSTTTSTASAPAGSQPQDGASRTRRVALQLAMRCSCTALATLAATDNNNNTYSSAVSSPTPKPMASSSAWGSGESSPVEGTAGNAEVSGSSSSDSITGGGLRGQAQQQQQQQQQIAAMQARLRDWWNSQVLEELCGNGSVHRSAQAVKQLRMLFEWLPGTAEN